MMEVYPEGEVIQKLFKIIESPQCHLQHLKYLCCIVCRLLCDNRLVRGVKIAGMVQHLCMLKGLWIPGKINKSNVCVISLRSRNYEISILEMLDV